MAIEVECPHCSKRQFVTFRMLGEDVDCSDCSRVFAPERPDSDEDGDPLAERRLQLNRRRRARRTTLLVATAAVVAIAAISGVVILVKKKKAAEPEIAQATKREKDKEQSPVPSQSNPAPAPKVKPKDDGDDPEPIFVPVPKSKANDDEPRPRPSPPRPEPRPEPTPPEPRDPFVSDRPAKEVFDGYFQRTSEGFKLFVSRLAYEKSDETEGGPMNLIDDELKRVASVFPPDTVKALRKFPVWVEWDHTIPRNVRAFAVYYGTGGEGLLSAGVDPRKSDTITILSLKTAVALKAKGGRQNTLLHEFAHIVHAKVFTDNTFITNAFQQAQARGLYDRVKHDNGGLGPAYASRNSHEYFAELTCAYFDTLDYAPHDRDELKDYDSVGYEIMTKAWGTPEQIEQRKRDAAKAPVKPKKK